MNPDQLFTKRCKMLFVCFYFCSITGVTPLLFLLAEQVSLYNQGKKNVIEQTTDSKESSLEIASISVMGSSNR